jgi:hypothetical protein
MKTIKCKYIFEKNYNPKYVNGAQGGINPSGEIVINFYLERTALPISQTYELSEDESQTAQEVSSEPDDLKESFVRVIENGIIMNYKTAKEIHHWLGQHIKTLESLSIAEKD